MKNGLGVGYEVEKGFVWCRAVVMVVVGEIVDVVQQYFALPVLNFVRF